MIEQLQNGFVSWAILAFCTVFGVIFSLYQFQKDRNKREFSVSKNGYLVVKNGKKKIHSLSILFDGKEVDNVTITKITIWNSGSEDIRREDIASERPLILKASKNVEILNAEIIVQTDSTNKFSIISVTADVIHLDFEYANRNDGIVIQVIHTGNSDDLSFDCKIKGGKPIKKYESGRMRYNASCMEQLFRKKHIYNKVKKINVIFVIIGILVYSCIIVDYILIHMNITSYSIVSKCISYTFDTKHNGSISLVVLYTILLFAMIVFGIETIKDAFQIGIPNKLKKFDNGKEDENV